MDKGGGHSDSDGAEDQRALLDRVLAAAQAQAPEAIVVFDLDSTVFDNRPRQALILREYGESHGLAPLRLVTPAHWTSWFIDDAMKNAGLDEDSVRAHLADAKEFWRRRFFTSDYCVHDVAIAGARDYLAAVADTGAQIAYVTGRHVDMGPGTLACMRAVGFPVPAADSPRTHLLLKPSFDTSDDAWKGQAYARLDALGAVVAAFDNEPAHINGYAARYIEALCVHLATDHSGRPIPVAPGVPSIRDFTR